MTGGISNIGMEHLTKEITSWGTGMWTGSFHTACEGTWSDVEASDDGYSDEESGSELEQINGGVSTWRPWSCHLNFQKHEVLDVLQSKCTLVPPSFA